MTISNQSRKAALIILLLTLSINASVKTVSAISALPSGIIPASLPVEPTLAQPAAGQPLILNQYIDAGAIAQAQNLSSVQPYAEFPLTSNAGYITVDQNANANIFFWFIRSRNNPATVPVLLYMSGGPGSTAMYSVFGETGPFYVSDNQTLLARDCTWINKYNVIYVDAPANGGYSYANNYAKNDAEVGQQIFTFTTIFFKLFPELKSNDFYVAGESYGGRFVVQTAWTILKNANTVPINLKGVITLAGFLYPVEMMKSADILYYNGFLNDLEYEYWKNQTTVGFATYNSNSPNNLVTTALVAPMMIMLLPASPFTIFTGYESYFNSNDDHTNTTLSNFATFIQTPDFRNRIHVGNNQLHDGLEGTLVLKLNLAGDMPSSNVPAVQALLDNGKKVLLMSGQRDLLVSPVAQRRFVNQLKGTNYTLAPRTVWTEPGQIHVTGYATKANNLTEVMIRDAGHNIANDQAFSVFSAVDRFINNQDYPGQIGVIPTIIKTVSESRLAPNLTALGLLN